MPVQEKRSEKGGIHLRAHAAIKKVFAEREYLYYAVPLAFLALYVFSKNSPLEVPIGVITLLSILLLLFRDVLPSEASSQSFLSVAREVATAFIAALVFWYALCFLLGTQKPLDVVTSCSMLPNLQRGDLVIIQGGEIRAPKIDLSEQPAFSFLAQKQQCTKNYDSGAKAPSSCTSGITVGGKTVGADKSNDIIVFESGVPGIDLVIHRAFARVVYQGREYFLTKGDNNNILDQEGFVKAVPAESVQGKVAFRIPLVGYFKLLLFGQFQTPPGCEYVISQG